MTGEFGTLPKPAKGVADFTVAVPDDDVDELKQLLKLSKIAGPTYENTQEDRRYGVTQAWLTKARDHWLNEFDWRACEAHINSFPNFKAAIEHDGETLSVHFLALFSKKSDAVPVVSIHGWPGSILEYVPQLGLISREYTPETLPYHIIIPSLPGYGFSSGPPVSKDYDVATATRILNQLMINLGFSTGYVATGGDIGSGVARIMAVRHDECKAIQINFCPIRNPPEHYPRESLTEFEKSCVERGETFLQTGAAYAMEQGTRPSTLGLALNSSPLALLAWVGEKFLAWSDEDPSLNTILQDVSLYWFTQTISRSFYPYRQRFEGKLSGSGAENPELFVKKPFGYQLFPMELMPAPKAWAATTGNLTWFRQHGSGGHFAALEKPAETKRDLEDFLKQLAEEKVQFGS
ncbi:uncharacterized protein KY384_007330 [Bacidia gigantensis]|uniref:uncharacterized protein n=1 Tax=Bacidia gigantensis TaxID=2732470 RepID=UPI001D0571DC|nr:uncharacterized protein KY384_007330 [Bacidia gigantensis]KAG8528412.1 hypothetical protein KY384_007330 [Bacidia gigantensis]